MTATRRLPPLADTLAVLLPDAAETALLRVCLGIDRGPTAAAWAAGIGAPGAPGSIFAERPALRRLYPMLHAALGSEAAAANPRLAAVLRAGVLWEEQRAARVREILSTVLSALRQVGVTPVLLKGVALAETVYPRPSMRHCHDIDLLVSAADRGAATGALNAAGFQLDRTQPSVDSGTMALIHRDGLPVQLHTRLLPTRGWSLAEGSFIAPAPTIEVAGEDVRIPGPADMLLQVCGLAADGAGGSPSWVVDAALILRKHRLTPDEWDALAKSAVTGGLALPVLAMLAYLETLRIAIPLSVLDILAARRPSWAEKDAVLRELRRRPGRLTGMIAHSRWRSRLAIARWLILPSPAHLKIWCAERGVRWTPAWYVVRPLRRLGIVAGILRTPAGSLAP